MTKRALDTDFGHAINAVVSGDSRSFAEILRSGRPLGVNEREAIIDIANRCAELARGDIGGEIGRPEIAAGNPKVVCAVTMFNAMRSQGMQISKAKSETCVEMQKHGMKISKRTLEIYIKITNERDDIVSRSIESSM